MKGTSLDFGSNELYDGDWMQANVPWCSINMSNFTWLLTSGDAPANVARMIAAHEALLGE